MDKFTTPCFIRKNTPELRKKLEELGYEPYKLRPTDDYKKASSYWRENSYDNLIADFTDDEFYYCGIGSDELDIKPEMLNGLIDCGENYQLFLALAALRDDSDKFQWFCDDEEEEYKSFFFCEYDDVEQHIHEKMDGWDCEGFHKATIEELINYFNKKQ